MKRVTKEWGPADDPFWAIPLPENTKNSQPTKDSMLTSKFGDHDIYLTAVGFASSHSSHTFIQMAPKSGHPINSPSHDPICNVLLSQLSTVYELLVNSSRVWTSMPTAPIKKSLKLISYPSSQNLLWSKRFLLAVNIQHM